jgi:hypothetical protein
LSFGIDSVLELTLDCFLLALLRKDWCKEEYNLAAFWGPSPGHNSNSSNLAFTILLTGPNVLNKVMASDLLTGLIAVNALTTLNIKCTTFRFTNKKQKHSSGYYTSKYYSKLG